MTLYFKLRVLMLFVLLLFFSETTFGQSKEKLPLDNVTGRVSYAATVMVPGSSSIKLHKRVDELSEYFLLNSQNRGVLKKEGDVVSIIKSDKVHYECSGKTCEDSIRFNLKICLYNNYFEYDISNIEIKFSNSKRGFEKSEPFLLYSSSENPVAAACIVSRCQAIERMMMNYRAKIKEYLAR